MTVRVEFKFSTEFTADTGLGEREHAEEHWFTDRNAALEAHYQACQGRWVEGGMRRPSVSPLRVIKNGSLLPDELRPAHDCDERPVEHYPTCSADRRDDTDRHLRAVPTTTDV